MIGRAAGAALLLAVAACSARNEGAAAGADAGDPGVNDVKLACEQRAAWAHASSEACTTCLGGAVSPPCTCDPARGACFARNAAVSSEPTCSAGVRDCVTACNGDCACVDGCYAGKAACRPLASALDGCVAAACDAACR